MSNAAVAAQAAGVIGLFPVTSDPSWGLLTIYDGSKPANTATAISTQNALVIFPCGGTWATPPASGIIQSNWTNNNDGSITLNLPGVDCGFAGTASWYRMSLMTYDSLWDQYNDVGLWDGTVGTSGADLIVPNVSLTVGKKVTLYNFNLTIGKIGYGAG